MAAYRLLAMEDNQSIADMICRVAGESGLEAQSAAGKPAIAIYTSFRPHIIVLDILMPEVDGLEFLQFLKQQESKAHIIILSGSSDAYRCIAENLGASHGLRMEANIPKPFRVNELRAVLNNIKIALATAEEIHV